MHTPDPFHLEEAIEAYLRQIDRYDLLSREEREEIQDHLITQTEDLQRDGLQEEEAFALAVKQFGTSELIREEYQQVKPFFSIRKAAIAASLFTFAFIFVAGLLNALSLGVSLFSREFELSVSASTFLDITLKIIFVLGFAGYLWWRFRRQHPMKIWELTLIPILGLNAPFFRTILTHFFFTEGSISSTVPEAGHLNNLIILAIIQLGLVLLCYRLVFKEGHAKDLFKMRTAFDSKAVLGIIVAYFLALTVFSFSSFISGFTLWLSTLDIFGEGWVRMIDMVLKLFLLWGTLAIIVSRIDQQLFFKKFELILIPLIGFVSPYVSDLLFTNLFDQNNFDPSVFGQLTFNSQMLLGLAVLMVTISTYILMFRERKQLKVSS